MCTQIIPITTAFFIVWNFKAQSEWYLVQYKNTYEFCRGRETSLVLVALVSFISIVMYIIYAVTLRVNRTSLSLSDNNKGLAGVVAALDQWHKFMGINIIFKHRAGP